MLGGQAFNFASCTQPRTAGSYTYTVFSTVVPNGTSSLLKMGLVAKTGGGWAGWGLPKFRGVMLGASAVIVWPTATGAQVSGFRLPESSYDAADINAAMGTFPILQAAAENVAGELRAVFTISMSDAPADTVASAAGVNYIYAIGPMGSSGAPGLGDHTRVAGYPYGSDVFQMKQEVTSVAPAPSSPPPSPPTSPAATVPAPKSEGAETATVPSLSSTGAAGNGGCSLQLSEGAAAESFTGCSLIQGVGVGFYVMWRTEPIASNPTKLLLTMGMNATTSGYVAVGFPVRPEHMVGSTSMILQTCPADSAGCTNGVKLSQWYLASTESSGVNPSNSVAISNIQAAALSATGQLVGSSQLEVDAPTTSGRRRLLMLENSDGSMPLIFAAGNVGATGKPLEHSTDGAATLAVASISSTGSPSTTVEGGSSEEDSSLKSAHAWMAAIGWGVLIPMGVVMARSFKEAAPLWFHLHRGMQTFGFILGTISLGLGFKLVDGEWAAEDTYHTVHRNLGVACTVLGFTQFSALVVRPKKGEKYRFAWELWHAWVGRSAAVLAIANIYYGILHMWDLGPWTWASYTAVLASIVAVAVAKDTSDWLKARRLRSADHVGTVQLTQPPLKVSRSPSEAYANMPA